MNSEDSRWLQALASLVLAGRWKEKLSVVELGAGSVGLAGLFAAALLPESDVFLSDGNAESVGNLSLVAEANPGLQLRSGLLRWGEELGREVDVALAADCFFFDEGREPLLRTLTAALKTGGEAICVAPSRNGTFEKFVRLAEDSGAFEVRTERDRFVSQFAAAGFETSDKDRHLPLVLRLRKLDKEDGYTLQHSSSGFSLLHYCTVALSTLYSRNEVRVCIFPLSSVTKQH